MLGYEDQDPAYITPVVVSQPEYNTVVLKKLLINSFSATDFEIFCFDYFRPVYDEFTPDMGQGLRVFLLISYCDKHHLYDILITKVRELNPQQFQKYSSQLIISSQEIPAFDNSEITEVQVSLEFDLSNLTEILLYTILIFIADILKVRRRQIRIANIRPGSVSVLFQMPINAAERLVNLHDMRNRDLQDLRVAKVKILDTRFDPYSLSLFILSTLTAFKSFTYPQVEEQSLRKENQIKQIQQFARLIYEIGDLLTGHRDFLKKYDVLQEKFQLGAVEILIGKDDLAKIDDTHNSTFRISRILPKIFRDFSRTLSSDENIKFTQVIHMVGELLKEAIYAQDYQHFISSLKSTASQIFEFIWDVGKEREKDETRFAKIFKFTNLFEDLDDEESAQLTWKLPIPKMPIPIVSDIAAGLGVITQEKTKDYLLLDDDYRNGADFGAEVLGESMKGDGILPGDIALIRQQPTVKSKDIAAIVIFAPDTEPLGVLKHYYIVYENHKDLQHWLLESSNPTSEHLVVIPSSANAKAIHDFYTQKINDNKTRNPIKFYENAELAIAGKYVGLVRKN